MPRQEEMQVAISLDRLDSPSSLSATKPAIQYRTVHGAHPHNHDFHYVCLGTV
jgi:hypothetical protein